MRKAAETTPAAPLLVRRLLNAWHGAECALAASALAFMALVVIADVAGREALAPLFSALNLPNKATGVYGASKLAVYALVIATYIGLAVAAGRGSHLVPRLAFGLIPPAWGVTMDRIADALTGACLLGVSVYAAMLVRASMVMGLFSPVLHWPLWLVQLVLPLGFASAALRYFCFTLWPELRPQGRGTAATPEDE